MKKIISLILSLVMILSFTACGTKAKGGWKEQYDLGVKYVNEAKYEEAILAFTKALEIDPKQTPVYIALAEVYVRQENYTAAAETLDKAITETKPDKADVYIDLIEIYIQQGDLDAAQDVLDKAIEELGETEELLTEKEKLEDRRTSREVNGDGDTIPLEYTVFSAGEVPGVVSTKHYDFPGEGYGIVGYNEDSHAICQYNYNDDGSLDVFWINICNDNGLCTRDYLYGSDGSLINYSDYTYDAAGYETGYTTYNPDGSVEETFVY